MSLAPTTLEILFTSNRCPTAPMIATFMSMVIARLHARRRLLHLIFRFSVANKTIYRVSQDKTKEPLSKTSSDYEYGY